VTCGVGEQVERVLYFVEVLNDLLNVGRLLL